MRLWLGSAAAACASAMIVALLGPAASAAPVSDLPTRPLPHATGTLRHGSATAARDSRPITRLIVRTRDGRPLSPAGLVAAGRLAGAPTSAATRQLSRGQSLVYLGAALTTTEAWAAARALQARSDVVWAEPDLPVYAADTSPATPNDPFFSSQWDLWDKNAAGGGYGTHVPAVWSRTKGDPSIVVAVLDTGLTVHPDLTGSVTSPAPSDPIVKGYDFVSADPDFGGSRYYVANDGNGRDSNPSDPGDWISAADANGSTAGGLFLNCTVDSSSWHGTHVTGTIVAKQGNAEGISGMAPGVKVQPVRVLGRCGGYTSDINDAIEWASGGHITGVPDNPTPASVINMSLGGPGACLSSTQTAIDDARSRGTTVVVAAGNEHVSIDPTLGPGSQPADCSGVVAVAASTRTGKLASYSNTGITGYPVALAAPGGAGTSGDVVVSTINPGSTTPVDPLSVPMASRYAGYAGTSMATPHVAAAVALLQSTRVGRMHYTPDEVYSYLTAHVTPFAPNALGPTQDCNLQNCGAGILDISSLPTEAPLAPTVTVAQGQTPTTLAVRWQPGDSGGFPVAFDVETSTTATGPWSPSILGTTDTSVVVGSLPTSTDHWVRVVARGTAGSATSAVVGPARPSSYAVGGLHVTGGVEHIATTWTAPATPATEVTGYALRYRAVGATDWLAATADATATSTDLTTWPGGPLAAGTYEVQVAALHDGLTFISADSLVDWSPSLTATVTSLVNRTTVSSTMLRPYRDGFQDSVVIRVATNRPGGASGSLRILNSSRVPVKIVPLAAGSSWSYTWAGLSSRSVRVPNGRYYLQAYLPDARGVLVAVAGAPSVVVASSQATRPVVTLSSTSLYPVRDSFKDTTTITTSAGVPAVMTWKVIRSGRVYWQATFTRRGTARAVYAGARIGGGTLPAGAYSLYVYAKGGEGTTTLRAVSFAVSTKKAVKTYFRLASTAYAAAQVAFGGTVLYDPSGLLQLPISSAVTFLKRLPTTVLPYASVRVTTTTLFTTGPTLRGFGYYGGAPDNPNSIAPVQVTSSSFLAPTAPVVAYYGGSLRWYIENDASSSGAWAVSAFAVTGYRWVLV